MVLNLNLLGIIRQAWYCVNPRTETSDSSSSTSQWSEFNCREILHHFVNDIEELEVPGSTVKCSPVHWSTHQLSAAKPTEVFSRPNFDSSLPCQTLGPQAARHLPHTEEEQEQLINMPEAPTINHLTCPSQHREEQEREKQLHTES